MKSFFAMILLLCISFSYTYAGTEYKQDEYKEPTKMEDREVIYYNHNLKLKLEDGKIEAEWDTFTKDGFDWYKLVYSTINTNPVYPDDNVVFIGNFDQRETSFKLEQGREKHYIRLCAVVLNDDYSKDRYCGKVQSITHEYEDGYEKEEQKIEGKDDTYNIEEKEVKKTELSESMKQKIEEVIEGFVKKFENKGYSDIQMMTTLDIVISRLGEFKNKTGYSDIVKYMTQVLEKYRDKYSNPLEELESIFDGL